MQLLIMVTVVIHLGTAAAHCEVLSLIGRPNLSDPVPCSEQALVANREGIAVQKQVGRAAPFSWYSLPSLLQIFSAS